MTSSRSSFTSDKAKSDQINATTGAAYAAPAIVSAEDADPLVAFLHEHRDVREATEADNAKVVRRIRWNVIPLIVVITLLLYIDKGTLGQASILGIFADTHLNQDKYNNLATLFYAGWCIGVWPSGYLLNKLPVGKWVTGVVFAWAIIIGLHPLAKSYGGLCALRFLLGVTEAGILPSQVVILNQYFTHKEQLMIAPLWWIACIFAGVPTGFIAYGCLWVDQNVIHPWRLFFAILGVLTFVVAVILVFTLPDNASKARFLSPEQRVWAIRRLQVNNSATENKKFKPYQVLEAFKDSKCWLFALHIFLQEIPNNLGNQRSLLIVDYGFSTLDTTLLNMIPAVFGACAQMIAGLMQKKLKNATALIIVLWYFPNLLGGILEVSLPWSNKPGLLGALFMCNTFGVAYANSLVWASNTCAGHTKRVTQTQMFMFAYGISNIISPQLWQGGYKPRFYPAWAIQIVLGWICAPLTIVVIHFYLKQQNKVRAAKLAALGGVQEHAKVQERDGEVVNTDHGMLDLTDREDLSYVYGL